MRMLDMRGHFLGKRKSNIFKSCCINAASGSSNMPKCFFFNLLLLDQLIILLFACVLIELSLDILHNVNVI